VLDLRHPECFEHRRHVVAEPTTQALLEAVPAADRVVGGPAPGLDGVGFACFCSSALPNGIQSPCLASIAWRSSMQRRW
jgi:hypothetical protein